jgi:hypothetical protein
MCTRVPRIENNSALKEGCQMNMPRFWREASSRRKRIYSAIFMLILAITVTFLGTLLPLTQQEAQQLNDQVAQISQNKTSTELAVTIFTNNFFLCLAMFIPVFGAAFGLFVMFSTGVTLGAEFQVQAANPTSSSVASISPTTAVLLLVFVALTFILEFTSYSIGMSESIWLFQKLRHKRWKEFKNTAKLIGIVAVLLTIGAIVETIAVTAIG